MQLKIKQHSIRWNKCKPLKGSQNYKMLSNRIFIHHEVLNRLVQTHYNATACLHDIHVVFQESYCQRLSITLLIDKMPQGFHVKYMLIIQSEGLMHQLPSSKMKESQTVKPDLQSSEKGLTVETSPYSKKRIIHYI